MLEAGGGVGSCQPFSCSISLLVDLQMVFKANTERHMAIKKELLKLVTNHLDDKIGTLKCPLCSRDEWLFGLFVSFNF